MAQAPHFNYWETEVLTSTPQKLRLLLIEGAIQLGQQATEYWQANRLEAGFTAAQRCQEILFELLATVRATDSTISRSISEIYVFLVKQIQLAISNNDSKVMSGIVRVLNEERVTWQEICDKYPQAMQATASEQSREITACNVAAIQPDGQNDNSSLSTESTFAMDA